jgi:hypothetical protein
VNQNRFSDLSTNGKYRIEGRHGFLKDHGNAVAPHMLQLLFAQIQKVLILIKDAPRFYFAGGAGNQAQNGQG